MDDYDDIEILDAVDNNKKRGIPSDKTEVLDPEVVKKVMERKIAERKGTDLPTRNEIREEAKEEIKEASKKESKKETKVVKKEEKVEKKTKKELKEEKKKDKKKKPAKTWEKIFWGISLAVIIACCVFYGSRLIHYYKIYNPKDASGKKVLLLGDHIYKNSNFVYEGSGIYNGSTGYVYKGEVNNNYLKYNNLLWRIIKINPDGTIVIVLDENMTMLPWNSKATNYKDSDIHKYLNNDFLNQLDKSYLVKTTFCEDSVESISGISCDKQNTDSYVTLLDITTLYNTRVDDKSYLLRENEVYWLYNYSSDKVWHTNGENGTVNFGQAEANNIFGIRPVVKLKSTIAYVSGDGTKEKPYLVEKDEKLTIGSKVMLGDDTWIVYDTSNNSTKLMLDRTLDKTYRYDLDKQTFDPESKESLAAYLNTEYLESLSYKDLLKEDEWVTGGYTSSLDDLKKNKVKAKVAIPSLLDYQYDNSVTGYFTTTSQEEYILVYENPITANIHSSKVTISRGIRPCISLTDAAVKKLKLDKGIYKVGA